MKLLTNDQWRENFRTSLLTTSDSFASSTIIVLVSLVLILVFALYSIVTCCCCDKDDGDYVDSVGTADRKRERRKMKYRDVKKKEARRTPTAHKKPVPKVMPLSVPKGRIHLKDNMDTLLMISDDALHPTVVKSPAEALDTLVGYATTTSSASLPRIKRQILPDLSGFPVPPGADGGAGGQPIPQASSNPFLDTMYTPYNLDWGLGVSVLERPFVMGANINFPTGNKMKPTDSVAGTFSYATPWNLRYGTQGGPFFPWQNKEFYKTAESISQVNALNNGAPLPVPENPVAQNQAAPQRFQQLSSSADSLPPLPPGML